MPLKQEHVDRIFASVLDRARTHDANKPAEPRKRRIQLPPPMPTRTYTDDEWAELGRQMAANQKAIVTNIEGKAYLDYTTNQMRELRDRYGCCGGEPTPDGYCFGLGPCTRHHEVQSCVTFVAGFLAWLDQINEQTSLAAVAVRLSDSSPFTSEVSNV